MQDEIMSDLQSVFYAGSDIHQSTLLVNMCMLTHTQASREQTWGQIHLNVFNPFYPEYDSGRSYPFYPEYDCGRSLHLARLPRTLTFWNPIGWLTPNDVSISGSLGNPYFSTNQCRSLGICRTNRAPPSQSEIKDGVES